MWWIRIRAVRLALLVRTPKQNTARSPPCLPTNQCNRPSLKDTIQTETAARSAETKFDAALLFLVPTCQQKAGSFSACTRACKTTTTTHHPFLSHGTNNSPSTFSSLCFRSPLFSPLSLSLRNKKGTRKKEPTELLPCP